jgi:PRC-barrel domain
MATTHAFETWRGMKALDVDGERIGTVQNLFVDRRTREPAWATVKTGMFGQTGRMGLKSAFVPLAGARRPDARHVQLSVHRDAVKHAPRIAAGTALSPEDERRLYEYYDGVNGETGTSQNGLERVL